MNYKQEINNAICNIRCNIEELQEEIRNIWIKGHLHDADYEMYDMELGYIAERIGELETEEE